MFDAKHMDNTNKILIGLFAALMLTGCGASAGFDAQAQRGYADAVHQNALNDATALSTVSTALANEQAQNAAISRITQEQNTQLQRENAALAARASSAWMDGLIVGMLFVSVPCAAFVAALLWIMNQQRTQAQYQIVPQVQPIDGEAVSIVVKQLPVNQVPTAQTVLPVKMK
jgi:hypothetical protein